MSTLLTTPKGKCGLPDGSLRRGVSDVPCSDRDIASQRAQVEAALDGADVFFGSLLFDYDQVRKGE